MVVNTLKMQELESALGQPLSKALKESYKEHRSWEAVAKAFSEITGSTVNPSLVRRAADRYQLFRKV